MDFSTDWVQLTLGLSADTARVLMDLMLSSHHRITLHFCFLKPQRLIRRYSFAICWSAEHLQKDSVRQMQHTTCHLTWHQHLALSQWEHVLHFVGLAAKIKFYVLGQYEEGGVCYRLWQNTEQNTGRVGDHKYLDDLVNGCQMFKSSKERLTFISKIMGLWDISCEL